VTQRPERPTRILPNDVAPALVAVLLVLGVLVLAVLGKPIPPELSTSLGAAVSWLFVRSAQSAEHTQANRRIQNGSENAPHKDYKDDQV